MVKNLPMEETPGDEIWPLGGDPWVESGIPPGYSCLGNPMATVHGVAKVGHHWAHPHTSIRQQRSRQDQDYCQKMGCWWQLPDLLQGFFRRINQSRLSCSRAPGVFPSRKWLWSLTETADLSAGGCWKGWKGKEWLAGPMLRLVLRQRKRQGNEEITPPHSNCSPWTKRLAPWCVF